EMKTRPTGNTSNADWMGSLCPALTSMPLKHLAVPGSHDSFSFWVDEQAPVGPDQKTYVKHLAAIFRFLAKKVMKKWSMTQNLTFREQLKGGIRYFDLCVSSKPGEPGHEIYFIHGLFGHKVRDGLNDINNFLNLHKKEVVFLDFNHHYAMSEEHHHYLIKMLKDVFGHKLCKIDVVEDITLNYLWENRYQVSSGSQYGSFHVSQAILTPRVKTIARGLVQGNLPTIMTWVEAQKPGVDGVNIITSDFVELVDFANTVIKLNNLLIQDRPGT
uniref:PI-PLC X domain-containing protein 2-like n=1 Tax=Sinocyclocheilus rhinocerous TaxID=307959 RepID=A0A673JM51_9TELE